MYRITINMYSSYHIYISDFNGIVDTDSDRSILLCFVLNIHRTSFRKVTKESPVYAHHHN